MADGRLFDSSSMTPPPAPEIDAMTCTVENVASDVKTEMSKSMLDMFVYGGPAPWPEKPFHYQTLTRYRVI
ncbi:hypothetical protein [Bradyrhizobium lupini]|uniref:hypothetical protein n=1 Tax=Rhizobium lupini TaxID=136996 RepID=UPI0034C6AD05